ncbi:putative deoxyribonuclease RhsA [Legionella birminghamensis]|uniref:Cell wall-associated polypeptide CWBP200 n=1 Tax=Legionella birminghamensis TaxID=28083 RepID=A0A378IEH3_9GAMM|nr:pre-toxin TG domain-containing protein [Legionella birminghamensis]KTC66772.1 putative deoxyribonuclease RhsA [Legionella birminghamensis]STX32921.1 Cell wall-associated polypeptide CWBP200 [Legionella birminghamensis]
MSQIFTGTGLGLQGSSLGQLGAFGPQGNPALGQNGVSLYINAANGNLILKQSDGFLATQGIGFDLFSTYNAQGNNGQRWLFNIQTKLVVEGEKNRCGSRIIRMGEDGHCSRFIFNSEMGIYLPENGGTESIQWTEKGWLYSQGSSSVSCEYSEDGLLTAWTDRDGHRLNYVYNDGQLTDIFDRSEQQNIHWQFQQGLLQDISFYDQGLLVHHLHYDYDNLRRLRLVTQDQNDGKSSWVAYDYVNESDLIESIRQSDGCQFHFKYDAQNRVISVSDGEGRSTRFVYEQGCTKISNGLGETWCYSFDDRNRLTEVTCPDNNKVRYEYQGNYLNRIIKGSLIWSFIYNEAGDCIRSEEPDGQIIQRTFDDQHHLLSENKSSVFNGSQHPGQSSTAYYVYDPNGHLRYAIAADGTVTEYRYSPSGQCINRRLYLQTTFGLKSRQPLLQELEDWSRLQSIQQISLVTYQYDWRGQLIQEIHYQAVDSDGNGLEQNALSTCYQYDARGRLIEKTAPTEKGLHKIYYFYDDLGRLVLCQDSTGIMNQYEYDDLHHRIIQTDSRGLQTLYLYDRSGLLLSKQQLGSDKYDYGIQRFQYDKAGRLISETDWEGKQNWYLYNKTGQLCGKIDANGHLKEYRYDAEGRLIQSIEYAQKVTSKLTDELDIEHIRPVHSSKDRYNWTFYNQYNQIAYQVDATGAVIGYRYNSEGQLAKKTAYAQRIAITDLFKAIQSGIIKPVEDKTDRHYRYYYDEAGNLQAEINGEGAVVAYQYDRMGNCIETRRFFNRVTVDDAQSWESIKPSASAKDMISYSLFNAAGLKEAEIDGEGFVTTYSYNKAGLLCEKRQYANALRKPVHVEPQGWQRPAINTQDRVTYYQYDERQLLIEEHQSNGLTLSYRYDNSGLMIEKKTFDRFSKQSRETLYRYDERGRLIESLNAVGAELLRNPLLSEEQIAAIWQQHAIHYSYSNNDCLLTKTDSLGQTEQFVYDEQGRLAYAINADGEVKEQQYDSFGNLTRSIKYSQRLTKRPLKLDIKTLQESLQPLKKEADEVSEYEYNNLGQVIKTTKGSRLETLTVYNAFGEVESLVQDSKGNSSLTTHYTYDKQGLLVQQDNMGTAINQQQSWEYDRFGRLIVAEDANHHKTTYKYNLRGECVSVTNAGGREKVMRYDALGRMVYESDLVRTIYQYDEGSNTLKIIQPDKKREITTQFNAFGDKISFTDFNGAKTCFEYDANGQLTEQSGPLGTASHYTYDSEGRLIEESQNGRTNRYSYDAAGRVLSKTIDVNGLELTTKYHFDGVGRQLKVIGPDQVTKEFIYDSAGNCIRNCIDAEHLNLITDYEYDNQGHLIKETIRNGGGKDQVTCYEWNALGQCSRKIIDPDGLALSTEYSYDAKGNLCSETDPRGNTRFWIYDELDQCRFEVDPRGVVTESRYDLRGNNTETIFYANRLQLKSPPTEEDIKSLLVSNEADRYTFREFDTEGHILLSFDALGYATAYTYDVQGNVTQIIRYAKSVALEDLKNGDIPLFEKTDASRVQYLAYDSLNRLCYQLDDEHHLTVFKYNQSSELVSKTRFASRQLIDLTHFTLEEIEKSLSLNAKCDQTTHYSYDKAGRLVAELNAEGFVVKYYYDPLGNVIATRRFAKPISAKLAGENWLDQLQADSHDRISRSIFDAAGREIYRVSAEGRVIGRQYDAAGNIIAEMNYSMSLNLAEYTEESISKALSKIAARETHYEYDNNSRLLAKIEAGNQTLYEYDANGNVVSKTDANKAVWHYEYDAANQLITIKSPETDIAYGYQVQRRSVITRNSYDSFGNMIKIIKDAEGVAQVREYLFDANNHCIQVNYLNVSVNNASLDAPASRQEIIKTLSEQFRFNAFGELEAQCDRAGNWQYFTYDREGHLRFSLDKSGALTEYQYNELGQLTAKCSYAVAISLKPGSQVSTAGFSEAKQPSAADRHEFYHYDRLDQLILVEKDRIRSFNAATRSYEILSPTTGYQYNAFGEVVITNVLLHEGIWSSSRRYYDRDGLLTGELNAENYFTKYQYNAFGELSEQIEYATQVDVFDEFEAHPPVTSIQDRIFLYRYNEAGKLQQKIQKQVGYQRLDSKGKFEHVSADLTTSYEYDAMGNLVKMTDPEGYSSFYSYDALGQLKAKAGPQTQAGRAAVSYTYDSLGHLVDTIRYANAAKITDDGIILPAASAQDIHNLDFYDANDQLILQKDSMGHLKFYSYDEQGNMARAWELLSQIDGSQRLIDKRYVYDAGGNLLRTATRKASGGWACEDSRFNVFGEIAHKGINGELSIHYEYDQLGRLWRTNSAGYYQLFVYDLNDKVTQIVTSTNAFRPATNEDGLDLSGEQFETASSFQTEGWEFDLQRQNNIYDKAGNLLTQYRESAENPLTPDDSLHLKTIAQSYVYDRWGNVLSHCNANGYETRYQYNGLNQILEQELPQVMAYDEHGVGRLIKPKLCYAYDRLGRQIGFTDANNHTVIKSLDAFGNVLRERDAKGALRQKSYDIFGRLNQTINELGGITTYSYDKANRLTTLQTSGSKQQYFYDEAGQLLQQSDGENNSSQFLYDELGNLTGKRNTQGYWRSMVYDDAGHKVYEKDELGNTQSWKYQNDRLVSHTDLGVHTTYYKYNRNGLLLAERSSAGRSIDYHYQGDGGLKQYVDNTRGEVQNYQYDNEGNMTSKQSSRTNPEKDGWLVESDRYEYDSLGRLIAVQRVHPDDIDNRVPQPDKNLLSIDYQYDAAGNLRHSSIIANYTGYEKTSSDEYYTYDENNRIRISKGKLIDGSIQIDQDQGSLLGYDAAGNLNQADKYENGQLHHYLYGYNKNNQLEWTQKDKVTLETKKYNQAGQVNEERLFDTKGNLAQINRSFYINGMLDHVYTTRPVGNLERTVSQNQFYYDKAANLTAESLRVEKQGQTAGYTLSHEYRFAWWDDYRRSEDHATLAIDYQAFTYGLSIRTYDVNGQLQDAIDQQPDSSGKSNNAHYTSSVDGIKSREDQTGKTSYLSVNGKTIADLRLDATGKQTLTVYGGFTPEGSAKPALQINPWQWNSGSSYGSFNAFFQNGRTAAESLQGTSEQNEAVIPNSPQDNLGAYTVCAGDTLESIALQVYGDSSLWYLIADANGITSREARAGDNGQMHVGQRLSLPPVFSNQHNNAATHNVFSEDYFIGNTSATAPMPQQSLMPSASPQRKHHKLLAKALTAVVGTIITVLAAAAVASVMGGTALAINGLGGVFKLGLAALSGNASLGVMAGASLSAGFIGNIASQGAANLSGLQHGIHWGGALTAALATLASAGVMRGMRVNGIANNALGFLNNNSPSQFNFASAAEMMSQNAVGQGIAMAANQQNHFDWRRLAATGLTSGFMGGDLGQKTSSALKQIDKSEMLGSQLNSLIHQGSRSLLSGQNFNAIQVLEDNLGDSIGNGVMNSTIASAESKDLAIDYEKEIESLYLNSDESLLEDINTNLTAQPVITSPDNISLAPVNNELDLRNTLTDLYNYGKSSVMNGYNRLAQGLNEVDGEYHFTEMLDNIKANCHDEWDTSSDASRDEPDTADIIASTVMDFVPVVGQLKAASEVWTGYDPVTHQRINRFVSLICIVPGVKLASKTINLLSKTKAVEATMKLAKGSKTLQKSTEITKKTTNIVMKHKGAIVKHVADASAGGMSALFTSLSTDDKHLYRNVFIGTFCGLVFGAKMKTFKGYLKVNAAAGAVANGLYQAKDYYKGRIDSIDLFKVGMAGVAGGIGAALTYGSPLIPATILRFGPEVVINKLSGEVYDNWRK